MKGEEKTLPATPETVTEPVEVAKKPGKLFIIVSYALALLALIAVQFVPLFNGKMLIQYFLAAAAALVRHFGVTVPLSAYGTFFVRYSFTHYEWTLIWGIAVTLIVALVMLIPVIVCKAKNGTNLRCALAAEMLAFLPLFAYLVIDLYFFAGTWNNYSMLIGIAVLIAVMAAQTIKYNGWLGVVKFVIFILALLTMLTLVDIVAFIPGLNDPLLSLSGAIGAYDADVTFMGATDSGIHGLGRIISLILGKSSKFTFADSSNVPLLVSQIMFIATTAFILLTVGLDIIALAVGRKTKKDGTPTTHKKWFIISLVKYCVVLVLIIAIIVLSFTVNGFEKAGIYMYFTALFVLLALIVEVIRYCVAKKKLKNYETRKRSEFVNETIVIEDPALTDETTEEVVEEPVAEEPATATETTEEEYQTNMFGDEPVAEEQPAEEVAEEQPVEGEGEQLSIIEEQPAEEPAEEPVAEEPVEEEIEEDIILDEELEEAEPAEEPAEEEKIEIDPFIDKLTNEERALFYDIFINRNRGKLGTIPQYEINGDNSDFFPSVFVHINRMRDLCSESLLNKIYKEIGKD